MKLKTKLPQTIVKTVYEPSNEDIQRIIEHAKGTEYSIPFQLGVLGCRRAEICALDISDLEGNELRIHRSKVYLDGKWIVKESPKTDASNRTLYLPDSLANEIREKGYIYKGYPAGLYKAIQSTQKKLGIPRFKFHALRSYFASYAHSMGIPDADIMAIGGWETDNVMKRIYRKSLEDSKQNSMEKLNKALF
jgi:integrase